ncbi:hypothetical protein QQS21_003377 [Conoideocrella luteorostrata]|uniref:thioredoxin-dependent peroxiredoxin n=1 Tax=Conoideocrella luteorostrata TaxID=1105319 RepID=A0AAJ0CTC5_9HYPO|nr:hypothetical protein QQS21_003377 [Conoideocrella luteorostrata]
MTTTTTLADKLTEVAQRLESRPKELIDVIFTAKTNIEQTFDPKQAIQPGAKLPEFSLPDATGRQVSSSELLSKGPLLITFYRGQWCPFCNLALRAFQLRLPEIEAMGANFVAVSPELPDSSLSSIEKDELKFPVLSDIGLKLARELGIVWKQPETLRVIFDTFGTDLKARNGDDSFELPIPTTILVDQSAIVRNVHANPDYFKRLEPQVALDWIKAL